MGTSEPLLLEYYIRVFFFLKYYLSPCILSFFCYRNLAYTLANICIISFNPYSYYMRYLLVFSFIDEETESEINSLKPVTKLALMSR